MKPLHLLACMSLLALLQGCYKDPVANFEYSYVDNLAPADVSFTNLSSEADKFQWDFGDGSGSAEKNPDHAFYNYVNPIVSLHASGRGGDNMMSKTIGLTSYFVKNSSSYSLYSVTPFFWDGENVVDDFGLGSLSPGYDSDVVITTHTIIDVAFEFSDGTMYLVEYSYTLNEHAASYLNITDETSIISVPASKKGTMLHSDLLELRENKQGILLKDLMAH